MDRTLFGNFPAITDFGSGGHKLFVVPYIKMGIKHVSASCKCGGPHTQHDHSDVLIELPSFVVLLAVQSTEFVWRGLIASNERERVGCKMRRDQAHKK